MTNWRPPRSVVERNSRAIRSMQNGSLDGRVVGSFPVKGQIPEDYDEYDFTEEEDATENPGGGGGSGGLRPSTEYFRVGDNPSLVLNLLKTPFAEESKYGKNYSTVHVYWNNVFQKDVSFLVGGRQVVISDPKGVLKDDDVITVKYWWSEGDGGDPHPSYIVDTYTLEAWFTGGAPGQHYGGVGYAGIVGAVPTGRNGGFLNTISTLYSTVGFFSHFGGAVRLPTDQHINLDNVIDAKVLLRFPMNATVEAFGYNWPGGRPGGVIVKKPDCGLGSPVQGSFPPDQPPLPAGTFSPDLVPGSITTHSGGAGISFAQLANVEIDFDGNHQPIPIICHDGWGSSMRSNGGCGGFGNPTFFDDTIYGRFTGHKNIYDIKFGGTIIVTRVPGDDD